MDIAEHIRTIPDFPKPGILFYDISTLLAHPQAWRHTIDLLGHLRESLAQIGLHASTFGLPHCDKPFECGPDSVLKDSDIEQARPGTVGGPEQVVEACDLRQIHLTVETQFTLEESQRLLVLPGLFQIHGGCYLCRGGGPVE